MGASADDTSILEDQDQKCPKGAIEHEETIMKTTFKHVTSGLAALAIGGAVAFAPVASAATPATPVASAMGSPIGSAGTDPLVPFGTEPHVPGVLGYVDSSHDEANTTNGQVDLPF
jgi:hypothetical protein